MLMGIIPIKLEENAEQFHIYNVPIVSPKNALTIVLTNLGGKV